MSPMRRRLLRLSARIETLLNEKKSHYFELMETNLKYHRLLVRRIKALNRRHPRFAQAQELLSSVQIEIDNDVEFLRTYRNPVKLARTRSFEIIWNQIGKEPETA